jgi:ATP-dependent Clp protease ATP-binding subunit ClpX
MSDVDQNLHCSFCKKGAQEVKKLIAGPESVHICDECVSLCHSILNDTEQAPTKSAETKTDLGDIPSPAKIKGFLDQYVIGQDYAKMVISVAVHNHYMRLQNPIIDEVEIEKSNILVLGPTGSGKTLIAQSIARCLSVPFAIADSTGLTEAGYVGDDVESIVSRLLQNAGGDVKKAEQGIIYLDEIDKKSKKDSASGSRDVSGEGVQQALLKIIEGSDIMVSAGGKKGPNAEQVKINTRNILFIVGGAFVGVEKVVEKALNKNKGLGFGANLNDTKTDINDLLRKVEPSHLMNFGIIPELIGRLPVIAPLQELSTDQMVRVLTEPKNAIVKQFSKMFKLEGVELEITPEALAEISEIAIKRKTGARGLRSILENNLIATQFKLPDLVAAGATKILVTLETIREGKEPQILYGNDNNSTAVQ